MGARQLCPAELASCVRQSSPVVSGRARQLCPAELASCVRQSSPVVSGRACQLCPAELASCVGGRPVVSVGGQLCPREARNEALQKGASLKTDVNEIMTFFGIPILSGYYAPPNEDLLSTAPDLRCYVVSKTMSRQRFRLVRTYKTST